MWPFRRKVEAPAAEGPRPVPAPVIRRDWAGLPPIQRFVGAHPLTAPSDQFSDDLATHQDPSVTTDTMGHQVSADAPRGLVLALARPTTRSDGPALIPRPRVQRSVAAAVTESGEWDGDEAAPDTARPTPLPMSAPAVVARELPVVAAEPSMQRLTSLAPGADPAPVAAVAQRSRAVPASAAASASTPTNEPFEAAPISAQRLTLGQSRRLGLGAPIKQLPDHSVQRSATDPLPLAQSPIPTLPQRGSEPMEASRVALPTDVKATQLVPKDTAVVQRVPTDISVPARAPLDLAPSTKAPMDLATGVRQTRTPSPGVPPAPSLGASEPARLELPLARTSARDEAPAQDRQPITPTVQPGAPSSPAQDFAPVLRPILQRSIDGGAPVPPAIESDHIPAMPLAPPSVPAVSTPSVQRVTDSSARPRVLSATSASDAAMAPLVGSRPLRPTAMLQRSASADTPHPDPRPQQGSESPFETPQQGGRELPLMRSTDDTPLPDPPRNGGSEFPFETPSQADSEFHILHPALPQTGREFQSPQGGREFRFDNPPLAARDVSSGRLPLAPSPGIAVQRASDNTRLPDPAPQEAAETLQALWYENRVAVSRPSEGETTPGSARPVAATGPSQASETEMDELARKLYDRIRSRLKTELLVDRERAGFLTDLR